MVWEGVIKKYRDFLPLKEEDKIVTLKEGNTPLIKAVRLGNFINEKLEIYLKHEGLNPTGSFKDRGMTVAISRALEEKAKSIICASTGNTSASAAAYAARAGLKAYVLIPQGKIALGKLSQAMMHGAEVIEIQGNFDEALELVKEISQKYPVTMVNSLNPYRLEGQKTAAFEVCDHLGSAPSFHSIPVGNAGNMAAYWMGYKEYFRQGIINCLPKMIGFQAEGAAPIVLGKVVKNPNTIASAIRIGNPANWKKAEEARDESGGIIEMVSDEEILEAYRLLALMEGIFCEPAAASSVAGVIKLNERNFFSPGNKIVCTITGHGLKDPNNAIKISKRPKNIKPKINLVLEILGF